MHATLLKAVGAKALGDRAKLYDPSGQKLSFSSLNSQSLAQCLAYGHFSTNVC